MLCISESQSPEAGPSFDSTLGIGLGLLAGVTYALYSWAAHRLIACGVPARPAMGTIFGIVVDFTYVPTWSRMAFTAFVTEILSRRIVGWRTMNRMPTQLPLDALEMTLWVRDKVGEAVAGVIQH